MEHDSTSRGETACVDRRAVCDSGELAYDSVLLVSFGGPEGPDDVEPFLRNVTRGRDVPARRLAEVAEQYLHFGGVSPINEQCRRLRASLASRLADAGHELAVYWGNRNWAPYLADTVAEMAADGRRRALAVVTSAYSSYSGCRQYLEDIAKARAAVGEDAPAIDKVRAFYDHPLWIEPFAQAASEARGRLPSELRGEALLVCTAHSVPLSMAGGCDYEAQLRETGALIADAAAFDRWRLAWQSRSGPPSIPWLEPDVCDVLTEIARPADPVRAVVVAPIGFVTDHMEVMWDLDKAAADAAASLDIAFERAVTPGTGPDERFIAMWQELIEERLDPAAPRRSLSRLGVRPDTCPADCCPESTAR